MKILMIGDIVGRSGRNILRQNIPDLRNELDVDLVIANSENAAGGNGITRSAADEIFTAGIDVLTMGNHVWNNSDIFKWIEEENRMVRPANYPEGAPGNGIIYFPVYDDVEVAVINLSGRIFMTPLDCPFRKLDEILETASKRTKNIIVDFHAEATSEKIAFGYYADGRVSAVLGTHTHVQTADETILPGGTGYITDLGMSGPKSSVIGLKKEQVIDNFITHIPKRFEVAKNDGKINGALLELDCNTGKTLEIKRIQK